MRRALRFVLLTLVFAGVSHPANAAPIVFNLTTEFSGATPASGPITYTIEDFGLDTVLFTITNGTLGPTEYIDDAYLNLRDGVSVQNLAGPTGTGANAFLGFGQSTDTFKADGDGYYDLVFDFMPPGDNRFGSEESVAFVLSGVGLDQTDFLFKSLCDQGCGNGSFFAAAHVQSIGLEGGSGWMGDPDNPPPPPPPPPPVPEPATLSLLGLGLVFAAKRLRK